MKSVDSAVLQQVAAELQAYVYLLVDPETGIPFYVGKGHGLRYASHVAEAVLPVDEGAEERSRKHARIDEILERGLEPDVWILRYGLSSTEYTAVEAAAIDLLMSFELRPQSASGVSLPLAFAGQLTNARRESARGHGVTLLQSLIEEYAAPLLTIEEPLLLITLNGWTELPDGEEIAGAEVRYGAGFRPEWLTSSVRRSSYDAIGESASAWWRIDVPRVEKLGIAHVGVVHRGVTRALLEIDPGSWETRDTGQFDQNGRPLRRSAFRFRSVASGELFDEVVGPYGRRVPDRPAGSQNAIYYWPRA